VACTDKRKEGRYMSADYVRLRTISDMRRLCIFRYLLISRRPGLPDDILLLLFAAFPVPRPLLYPTTVTSHAYKIQSDALKVL
jgi:hypothetical protein